MWDVHNFATKLSKAKDVKEFDALVKFHEFEMIHGMYVLRCYFFSPPIWVQYLLIGGSLTMYFVFFK